MLTSDYVWLVPDGSLSLLTSASSTLKAELVKTTLLLVRPSTGVGTKYNTFVSTVASKNPAT